MEKEMTLDEKINLRKKQVEMALNGDVRMLIWLGKQYLGQTDSPMVITEDLPEGFELEVIGEKCEDCGKKIADEEDEFDRTLNTMQKFQS